MNEDKLFEIYLSASAMRHASCFPSLAPTADIISQYKADKEQRKRVRNQFDEQLAFFKNNLPGFDAFFDDVKNKQEDKQLFDDMDAIDWEENKKRKKQKAHMIDKAVGVKLSKRRRQRRVSRKKLGFVLGISSQQIEKYETGNNRIGAGALKLIARHLDVPVGYFFGEC